MALVHPVSVVGRMSAYLPDSHHICARNLANSLVARFLVSIAPVVLHEIDPLTTIAHIKDLASIDKLNGLNGCAAPYCNVALVSSKHHSLRATFLTYTATSY